jgi:hypothetical protein
VPFSGLRCFLQDACLHSLEKRPARRRDFDNRRTIAAPCGSEAATYSALDTSVRSSFALTKDSTTAPTSTFTAAPRFYATRVFHCFRCLDHICALEQAWELAVRK